MPTFRLLESQRRPSPKLVVEDEMRTSCASPMDARRSPFGPNATGTSPESEDLGARTHVPELAYVIAGNARELATVGAMPGRRLPLTCR